MTAVAPAVRSGPRARAAAETALIALTLGALADLLFRYAALGLNAPLWIGALVAALQYTGRHREARPRQAELGCLALSFAAALALAWRASPALQALLFLASGALLVLAVAIHSGLSWRRTGIAVSAGAIVAAGVAIAIGVYRVQSAVEMRSRVLRGAKESLGATVRIVVIGVPILVVFGLLFAAADAVFQDRLMWLTRFDLSEVVPHVFWFAAGIWLAGGVIWAEFEGQLLAIPELRLPDARRLKTSEVGFILGALAALFAAFVAVQLRYLFGGHDLVQHTIDLTYAEYARRGFFELVTAAALLLPLLLTADWARRHGGRDDVVYRLLAGLLVLQLFVVIASALQRMNVYEQAYGLTELRLYVVAFLLWLAAVFALFLRTLVFADNEWFVAGSIATAAVVLAALTVGGPDGVIAQRNIERAVAGQPFDAEHATHLGADAVPILARNLEQLSPTDACIVARSFLDRWGKGSADAVRSWNWSRSIAVRTVQRESSNLQRACEAR